MPAFRKILVANRGEIALRVIRACRELAIPVVAVYSDADRTAPHVLAADEAYRLGPAAPAQSYLAVDRILAVAEQARCDAVHPGYGFLAENADFAHRCAKRKLAFIGPSPAAIEGMGGKIAAREAAKAAGVPIVPGTTVAVHGTDDVLKLGTKLGYPIAVKAAAGGGGKGLYVAHSAAEVTRAVELAAKEASAYFKDATLYVEKYLERAKHVEVQILADKHGNIVHLGERDCSMQRRHQKLIEETPACISPKIRKALISAAVKLAKFIGYDSVGTIECLVDDDGFYFLEMNTRIQVEHTITEMVWGLDLVKAQIRVAAGQRLWFAQRDLAPRGHAIECRINAESPVHDFRPCAGRIEHYAAPAGPGVRVDASAFAGWVIPQEYDSLLDKLVVWGQDREEARHRTLRALGEYRLDGVDTTIPFLRLLLAAEAFASGEYATPTVEHFRRHHAKAIEAAYTSVRSSESFPERGPATMIVEVNDKRFEVRIHDDDGSNGGRTQAAGRAPRFKPATRVSADGLSVRAPMHGIVAEVRVRDGDPVRDGQVVAVIEAMKMMNEVVAQRAGTVAHIHAKVGQTVETGEPLITLADTASERNSESSVGM